MLSLPTHSYCCNTKSVYRYRLNTLSSLETTIHEITGVCKRHCRYENYPANQQDLTSNDLGYRFGEYIKIGKKWELISLDNSTVVYQHDGLPYIKMLPTKCRFCRRLANFWSLHMVNKEQDLYFYDIFAYCQDHVADNTDETFLSIINVATYKIVYEYYWRYFLIDHVRPGLTLKQVLPSYCHICNMFNKKVLVSITDPMFKFYDKYKDFDLELDFEIAPNPIYCLSKDRIKDVMRIKLVALCGFNHRDYWTRHVTEPEFIKEVPLTESNDYDYLNYAQVSIKSDSETVFAHFIS